MVKVDEQRAWTDVTERDHKINKIRLKGGHLQCLHVSKEVSRRHHYGEIPQPFLGNPCAGVSLSEVHVD